VSAATELRTENTVDYDITYYTTRETLLDSLRVTKDGIDVDEAARRLAYLMTGDEK